LFHFVSPFKVLIYYSPSLGGVSSTLVFNPMETTTDLFAIASFSENGGLFKEFDYLLFCLQLIKKIKGC